MNPEYIIVQAGGKGSRMQTLTRNKPKALVPIQNLPMIFHLFQKYPDKKYMIIGDYKYDVLEKYLNTFAEVDFTMICATGKKGTCAGLQEAVSYIPDGTAFMMIWCDLILPAGHVFPEDTFNYVGISKDFLCRWSYKDGNFYEEKSSENGVAGYFLFQDRSFLKNVPLEGEFVQWLCKSNIPFREYPLYHTHEYGLYSEWEKLPKLKCRPFNQVEIQGDVLVKKAIDSQGEKLAKREAAWYQKIQELTKNSEAVRIPKIYDFSPLAMEVVSGKNIYEYNDIPYDQKLMILKKIVNNLNYIHSLGCVASDQDSFYQAYIGKTIGRLEKIRDLVPFANDETIKINGRNCRNIFYHWDEVRKEINKYFPKQFVLIHGDCTFSNMLLNHHNEPVLIDPRGYFGNTELFGDEAYDWVKLYYSLVSNYDQFNLKRFSLDIGAKEAYLQIESNHWEDMENDFFALLDGKVTRKQMKLLLSITWLSLTTYAWEDYDSICGAFYQGILYLEDVFHMSDPGTGDKYFGETIRILSNSLKSLDMNQFEMLIELSEKTLCRGHKIIASGLGKNVSVCEKFVGSMLSLGLNANFLHTNTAVHGDLGMIKDGDLVIVLSKSGNTSESVYLIELLKKRDVNIILLTFSSNSRCEKIVGRNNCIVVDMEHEGDMWNIMPNNSTTLNLIILQGLVMTIAERMHLDLQRDFAPNHPGGAIGKELFYEERT